MADRWLVIGLGNPGTRYENTRHNIGQLVIDNLSDSQKLSTHKSGMQICEVQCDGQRLILAKSRSFMNETGGPAKALLDFYKIDSTKVIAIHDELDLSFNSLRIKQGGGDNGHNGLKSLTSSFSTADYFRIRMGIGRPIGNQDPADFVLKPFSNEERKALSGFVARGADAISALVLTGIDKAQTAFNS
jgi:PTH1 family peptidyl-tRNA hydrolase